MPTTTRIRTRSGAPAGALVLLLAGVLAWPSAAGAAPLAPGAKGPRVAALQRAFGIEVDGVFGEPLRVAVMRLQRAHGLPADGSVGPATWGLLVRIRARARRLARAAAAARAAAQRPPGRDREARPALPRRVRRAREMRPTPARPPRRAREARPALPRRARRAREARPTPARPPRRAREARPAPARPPRRAREARPKAARRASAAAAGPRAGALGGGWGAALVTTLRLSSYRAIGDRAARPRLRTGAQPTERTRRRAALALQGPVLRIGAGEQVRTKRPRKPPAPPLSVRRVIAAGDRIATMPYRYGGGHGNWNDSGYDCSGSVSYALHGGGLLDVALASGGFTSWGEPGPGRWISVYANAGHAFMVVAGRRFDTSGRDQTGSRWQGTTRGGAGYVVRHPAGL